MNKSLPSERQILLCIYEMYDASYPGSVPGENDPYVPIDVSAVAAKLGCKPHLLFGFLYYFLENKYGYKTGENSRVSLFALQFGNKRHGVNFPYLAAVLSGENVERSKHMWSIGISLLALALSVGAIIAQVVTTK